MLEIENVSNIVRVNKNVRRSLVYIDAESDGCLAWLDLTTQCDWLIIFWYG